MTDLTGEWENQNGSRLSIESVDGGVIQGRLPVRQGAGGAGPALRRAWNRQRRGGFVRRQFSGRRRQSALHLDFSGRLDGDAIHTLWVLVREFEDAERTKPTQPWNAFLVNADRFTRVE